jgi:hypothetical protein
MIEHFKSKIRPFLPMSFWSKSWEPSRPLFVTRITRGFLEKKAFSRNLEITVNHRARISSRVSTAIARQNSALRSVQPLEIAALSDGREPDCQTSQST